METEDHLGPVTLDCDVCTALRGHLRALTEQHEAAAVLTDMESEWTEGLVHPNVFLEAFALRLKHEKATGHTTFGWKFLNTARAATKTYAKEDPSMAEFWTAFATRFLVPA
jgi:hypothetical protein